MWLDIGNQLHEVFGNGISLNFQHAPTDKVLSAFYILKCTRKLFIYLDNIIQENSLCVS